MATFPFVHREIARFSDLDPMGHVNNAVYLTWIENARIEFLRRLGAFDKPDTSEMAMILARVELDFRAPAGFGDDPQSRFAFEQMGPGWRDEILPRLAEVLAS